MSVTVGVPPPDWGEAVHAEVVLRQALSVSAVELIDPSQEAARQLQSPEDD